MRQRFSRSEPLQASLPDESQPLLRREPRLPAQHLAGFGVAAVPAPYPLEPGEVVPLGNMLSAISATKSTSWLAVTTSSISRLSGGVTGTHDPVRTLDAVVNVHEGTSLLTITLDLHLAAIETRATLRQIAAGAFSLPPSWVPKVPWTDREGGDLTGPGSTSPAGDNSCKAGLFSPSKHSPACSTGMPWKPHDNLT